MAATELLDYNQIQEQSPSGGDSVPAAGGLIQWQFRADPNLAWDPSQTFFAMDVTVRSYGNKKEDLTTNTLVEDLGVSPFYDANSTDLRPFFPLRCFSSMSHIIDGVTVAHSNNPYADKIIQEKFLHETTQSNLTNFESMQLARAIDDGIASHNIFKHNYRKASDMFQDGWSILQIKRFSADATAGHSSFVNGTHVGTPTHTILFQPPFDFWTKHQRVSGGNHQILMNLRPSDQTYGWGGYVETSCVGIDGMLSPDETSPLVATGESAFDRGTGTVVPFQGLKSEDGADVSTRDISEAGIALARRTQKIIMSIDRIRLLRRMVRFTVERPIATQEFNLTEMELRVGQPAAGIGANMTQNFLLPSSTFGLVFYWKEGANTFYDTIGDYPKVAYPAAGAGGALTKASLRPVNTTPSFKLKQFYFTYGGETYPAQRINNIGYPVGPIGVEGAGQPLGYEKLHTISNQLMGVYNMPMDYLNTSFGGTGLMERLGQQMFFFPVAKHSNSDNSDLQVFWEADVQVNGVDAAANLVVVALYDARVELSYNNNGQLEKVTKTEWK